MKSTYFKRFASSALAGVMALSMAAPAFAAGDTTVVTGTYTPITLDVTVPSTGKAVINPYGLPLELAEGINVVNEKISTAAPLMVENRSAVALKVGVKEVVGIPKGELQLVATDPATDETAKKAHVVFQMFPADGIKEDNYENETTVATAFAALKKDQGGHDSAKDVNVMPASGTPAKGESKDNIIQLEAGTTDGKLKDGGAAFFRLSGEVAKKASWAATDGFTAKIVFSFEPNVSDGSDDGGDDGGDDGETTTPPSIAAAGGVTTVGAAADLTLTLTPNLPEGVTVGTWNWTSSDTSKATVSGSGTTATVEYKDDGDVTITVTGTGSDTKTYTASIDLECDVSYGI